jgi:membrane protease YdiL (CAAX protease family)
MLEQLEQLDTRMKRMIPAPVVFALVGLAVTYLACLALEESFGSGLSRFVALAVGIAGAIAGWVVGAFRQGPPGRRRNVAWWCVTMSWIVGTVSFLSGFVGPIVFSPDSPQGPLLGIFITGPLGAVVGAACGVVIGFLVPSEKGTIYVR